MLLVAPDLRPLQHPINNPLEILRTLDRHWDGAVNLQGVCKLAKLNQTLQLGSDVATLPAASSVSVASITNRLSLICDSRLCEAIYSL